MTQKEIKELQERCYSIGNSKFPLDTLFNDIRDNPNPNFNKESAYEDLKLIVDEVYRLRELEKTPNLEEVKKEWEESGYKWKEVNDCIYIDNFKTYIRLYTNNKLYESHSLFGNVKYLTIQEHQLLTKTFKALGW